MSKENLGWLIRRTKNRDWFINQRSICQIPSRCHVLCWVWADIQRARQKWQDPPQDIHSYEGERDKEKAGPSFLWEMVLKIKKQRTGCRESTEMWMQHRGRRERLLRRDKLPKEPQRKGKPHQEDEVVVVVGHSDKKEYWPKGSQGHARLRNHILKTLETHRRMRKSRMGELSPLDRSLWEERQGEQDG